MSLTLQQRLARIDVRVEELGFWRERETVAVDGWQFNGAPIAIGGFWPIKDGAVAFDATAALPEHWKLEDTRLLIDVGGESLITLTPESKGEEKRFGLDPYHQEFPVPGRRFKIHVDAVARLPFGEPVREPRLTRRPSRLDRPAGARTRPAAAPGFGSRDHLGAHEVVPHLITAAEHAFSALDWPSATQDYVARTAPQHGQQKIWQLPPLKANPGRPAPGPPRQRLARL
jgi:alpha-mannosidase